ncbi:MAG: DUF2079 domain-containing protein, partial [Patescibacteria group bacterium]
RMYWISLALLLLTKESMAVVAICIGIFVFLSNPKRRKEAIITVIASVIYYLIITRFILPSIAGGFFYGSGIDYPNNIPHFVHLMTDPPEKIQTFLVSMFTFGFLPLLNIITLPLILQDLLTRYIIAIPGNIQYTLFYHYNLALAPLLMFSSIWSIKTVQDAHIFRKLTKFLPVYGIVILVFSLYFHRLYEKRGPLLLVFNPAFYQTTRDNAFEWELVKNVPKDGTVMTQNHLSYMFTHQGSFLFPSPNKLNDLIKINPMYIVVDFRDGQNPNDFFPLDKDQTKKLVDDLVAKEIYSVYFQKGTMFIYKKNIGKTIPADLEKMKTYIAMISLNTDKGVGCGDGVKMIPVEVPYNPYKVDILKLTVQALLQSGKSHPKELYNTFENIDLRIEKFDLVEESLTMNLTGKLSLGGVCDSPRFKAQLEQTFLQFPWVKKAVITINGTPIDDALSEK